MQIIPLFNIACTGHESYHVPECGYSAMHKSGPVRETATSYDTMPASERRAP